MRKVDAIGTRRRRKKTRTTGIEGFEWPTLWKKPRKHCEHEQCTSGHQIHTPTILPPGQQPMSELPGIAFSTETGELDLPIPYLGELSHGFLLADGSNAQTRGRISEMSSDGRSLAHYIQCKLFSMLLLYAAGSPRCLFSTKPCVRVNVTCIADVPWQVTRPSF